MVNAVEQVVDLLLDEAGEQGIFGDWLQYTPAQRKAKRRQQELMGRMAKKEDFPTWEVVWVNLKDTDGYAHEFEFLSGLEEYREKVLEDVIANNPDIDRDSEEFEEIYNKELTEYIEGIIYEEQLLRYENVIGELDALNGQGCWREVTVKEGMDVTKLERLGIYWTYSESLANAHWGRFTKGYGQKVVFHGRVDINYIDPDTVYLRMEMDIGEEEMEVRFLPYSPIWIYDIKMADGSVIKIDDWRRT